MGISDLIDAACACIKCGKRPSACECPEEPPIDPVRLVCTVCGDELVVERDSIVDPDGNVVPIDGDSVECECPKHGPDSPR